MRGGFASASLDVCVGFFEPRGSVADSDRPLRAESPVVLVIDDSDVARARMVELLTDAGMRVIDLPSPIGATRALAERHVDVLVIDVYLPGMRGDRLASLFRGNPRFRNLGVVLVSAESEALLHRLLNETDADAGVYKAELEQLVPAVQRALERARRG